MDWIEYRQTGISYAILHTAETALEITPPFSFRPSRQLS